MGCCSSGAGSGTAVQKERRRLSVGEVDKGQEVEAEADDSDQRGLLTSLNQQNVIDILGEKGEGGDRKFSIGSNTDQGKVSFANKTIQNIGVEVNPVEYGLGYTCRKGLKPESPNQDSWSILNIEGLSIYGVFDGHGQKGHDVSNFVKETIPKLIVKDARFKAGNEPDQFEAMLKDVFKKTQTMVSTMDRMKKLSAQMSGTTATVCIQDHAAKKLFLGHVADSTCVMGRYKDETKKVLAAEKLTRDHKPDLPDERQRIEKAGGRVVFDGYANHRVYAKNGRYPGLNMSRCLGDLMGHADAGCSAEPETKTLDIGPLDHILLLCSDGVWEFLKPEDAVNILAAHGPSKGMLGAEKLAKEAWDKWIQEEGGTVVDDITVVAIFLNQPPKNA